MNSVEQKSVGSSSGKAKRLVPAEMMLRARIAAIQQVVAELSVNEGSKEFYAYEITEYTEEAEKLATNLYHTYTKHQ